MEENSNSLQTVTAIELTENEQRLLEVLLNPDYRMKSITDLCNVAKISRMAYYRAFEKPEFKALYKTKSKELVDNAVAPVLNTFVREALRGSFQHGKVILEMAGLYSEKQQIDINTDININLNAEERKSRIAELLGKIQLEDAISVPFKVIEADSNNTIVKQDTDKQD